MGVSIPQEQDALLGKGASCVFDSSSKSLIR